MRILVIEDDRTTGDYILQGLRQEGHVADLCRDGRDGLITAQTSDFDVLVVDRMLPDLDGLSLVRTLRAAKNLTPALFLTALGGVDEHVDHQPRFDDDRLGGVVGQRAGADWPAQWLSNQARRLDGLYPHL